MRKKKGKRSIIEDLRESRFEIEKIDKTDGNPINKIERAKIHTIWLPKGYEGCE